MLDVSELGSNFNEPAVPRGIFSDRTFTLFFLFVFLKNREFVLLNNEQI